jgi:hypothetical protein
METEENLGKRRNLVRSENLFILSDLRRYEIEVVIEVNRV